MRQIYLAVLASTVAVGLAFPGLAQSPTAAGTKFVGAQLAGEVRASNLIGVVVRNKTGDVVGDINDVVFGSTGQVSVYIIGVGGVLGIGEKNVAVPFDAVTLATDSNKKRTASLDVTMDALKSASPYVGERTTFEKVEDGAASLATAASQKAKELKDRIAEPAPTNPPK